jgi:eukaryotic-like serine/threonine-protein kinase
MVDTSADVLLGGRYRLLEQVGSGSMGTVHRARDEFLGREVAVKVIRPPLLNAEAVRDDEDEVKVLARLNHPSLVTLFDAGTDLLDTEQPRIYLVMELIKGPNLRDRLSRGPLPPLDVGQIGYDLAEGLSYVHDQGVIHRDVKPANIMIFDSHNHAVRARAKLADFGIAVMMEAPLAGNGSFIGTAAYVSPEQAKGEPLGPPSDIYSLGLVLLECLTGVVAYPGEALPSALARLLRAPDIPAGLGQQWIRLLTVMTATEPAARPSAREVAIALDGITLSGKRRHTTDPSIPTPGEAGRRQAIHQHQILDTPADGALDRITALAARIFSVPRSRLSAG